MRRGKKFARAAGISALVFCAEEWYDKTKCSQTQNREENKCGQHQTKKMVDALLEAGFNYFDTAHGYLQGRSETTLRECLTGRYPRDRYVLTNKLTANFFKNGGGCPACF